MRDIISAPKIEFQKELNPAQYEAATHMEGPRLVIAGAGSGKTRVLVYRVAKLIESGVDPKSILLLTFTRKAANEMMKRAADILDSRCLQIKGGTFHAFCNRTLRRFAAAIDYPSSFTIADRADAEAIIAIFRGEVESHKRKKFPKRGTLMNIISKAVNTGKTIGYLLESEYYQYTQEEEEIIKIRNSYVEYKREHHVMDYDDLLTWTVKLLEENDAIRSMLSNTYQYIMVDEYQDTNQIQARIAALIASDHHNIMVVGDDSQSIYSFRGAHFQNIMQFPRQYKNCPITRLEQNYRSTQPILNLTNGIIENAKERYTKILFSDIKSEVLPYRFEPDGKEEEAEYICEKILELQKSGVKLNRIAVLFRSGFHAYELEVELNQLGIPYDKFGGLKFMEAAHIKDLLAFLRVCENPLDVISWRRVLLLIEGIGQVTAGKIVDALITNGLNELILKPFSSRKYGPELERLHQLLERISEDDHDPITFYESIRSFYNPLLELNYDDFHSRLPDLDALSRIAQRYTRAEDFLSDLTLNPPTSSQEIKSSDGDEDRLVLSTIHSAKGLEWHSVFILRLINGCLPSKQAFENEAIFEEERRLFYVATTRAEINLWLSSPSYWVNDFIGYSEKSDFLEEMPNLSSLTKPIDIYN